MPRKETKTTSRLYAGVLYGEHDSFAIVNVQRWHDWLASHRTFYADLPGGSFTARRESRNDLRSFFWYAYRKHAGKLYKVYLGRSEDLTLDRLHLAALQLATKTGVVAS